MKKNFKLLIGIIVVSVILSIITVCLFDVVNTIQRDFVEVIIGASIVYFAILLVFCIDMFDLKENRRTYGSR